MKRKQIILISAISVAVVSVLVLLIIIDKHNERNRLIARAFEAQKRITYNYSPNMVERFFDFFRGPEYWDKEYFRIRDELIEKGYFKKSELTLPNSKFEEVWKVLWNDTDEDKLMLFSYSPYEPNELNRTIVLIGPHETVDKKMKILEGLRIN